MAQLVAEEMGFGQGWNSPSHTLTREAGRPLAIENKNALYDFIFSPTNRKDDPGFTYPSGKPRYTGIGGGSPAQDTSILATATLPDPAGSGSGSGSGYGGTGSITGTGFGGSGYGGSSYQSEDKKPLLSSGSSIQVRKLSQSCLS